MLVFAPLLALIAAVAAQQDPAVNTPSSVVQCQPVQITWSATRSPVFLSIIPGGKPGSAPLIDFGQQAGNSYTWVANITAGTSITCQVRDSAGALAYSAPVTVLPSSDSSCLGAGAPGGSSAAPSAPGASSSASVSSALSSIAASASSSVSQASTSIVSPSPTAPAPATPSHTGSSSSTRAATATSSTPSASPSGNAAIPNAKVGLAGLLGLAAAVVMA